MSARNAYRFRSAHFSPRIVCLRKIELAQFTFLGFTKLISHISFTIIRVNCAFGFVSDYVIVTDIMLFV